MKFTRSSLASRSGSPPFLWGHHTFGREIWSLKAKLQATLGHQPVNEEVLRTLLVETEGILNSKPLGYTSSDIADQDPVTPNCLLMGRGDSSQPQIAFDSPEILGRCRWRHIQVLADVFWKHFLKHYVPGQHAHQKWQTGAPDLQKGEVHRQSTASSTLVDMYVPW